MRKHESIVHWKGRTLGQICSVFVKNGMNVATENTASPKYSLSIAHPLKLYRKDTPFTLPRKSSSSSSSTNANYLHHSRTRRRSIDENDRPGGFSVDTHFLSSSSSSSCRDSCEFVVLAPKPNLISETAANCSTTNALRRVRSSGMIKPVSHRNGTRNNDAYCTSTKQYLDNRQLSIAQNEFQYFRTGNMQDIPGSALSRANVYAAQGTNHAVSTSYLVPAGSINNITFAYTYHSITYPVTILAGASYTISDLQQLLARAMLANGTFLVDSRGFRFFPLQFGYNNLLNTIVLTAFPYSYNGMKDQTPNAGDTRTFPSIVVAANNTAFSTLVGFAAGQTYPSSSSSSSTAPQLPVVVNSTSVFLIGTVNYKPVFYKPNNPQFAQQGGVNSSDRLLRLKYNTITSNGMKFANVLGNHTASAMAYGVSDCVYTIKDKLGFPITRTPKIDPITGKVSCCSRRNSRLQLHIT